MIDKHGMIQSGVTPPENETKEAEARPGEETQEQLNKLASGTVSRIQDAVQACKGCSCGRKDNK